MVHPYKRLTPPINTKSKDIIHLLPDSVANQIAAGEVIQRPASVVKELVENSIDAGASEVSIIIKDAGRTLIQVIDNGSGMSPTDARMAFERHATSKISQATDLFSLHTMGFRGEALPSVVAVSEVEVRTMRADDVTGTRLCISASKVQSQEPDVCSPGTNIMVKRLFFNLPARRKFLKKDPVEMGHIMREFERLALVNTDVSLSLTHNDVVLHQLSRAPLKQRIADLFGKSMDHQLIPVDTETSLVKISGYVGLPQNARKRGALQYFFVNGRNMRHPYFHKAVLSCYQELIAADTQPNYFINFTVDPETIDVNIHPQKHEIKFENEQPLWQILCATVRESLGRYNAVAAIDFDTVDAPDIPAFNPNAGAMPQMPQVDFDPSYNPFSTQPSPAAPKVDLPGPGLRADLPSRSKSVATDWEKLYEGFTSELPAQQLEMDLDAASATTPALFQVKNRYIIAPSPEGVLIIDQYRAHVRILYEKFAEMVEQGRVSSQRLIFPEAISLDPSQNALMQSIEPTLQSMGFDISNLGDNSWAVNAIPSVQGNTSATAVISDILAAVAEEEEGGEMSLWQRIALSMARAAAIKRGTALSKAEMDVIVADLFRLPTPNFTPDGHAVYRLLSLSEMNSMF